MTEAPAPAPSADTPPSAAKKLLFTIVLLGVASVFALLAGELFFRLFTNVDPRFYNAASTQQIIRPDTDTAENNPFDLPIAMLATRPNTVGHNAGHEAIINRHGMRDERDYTFQKPEKTRRVMMVGDSVTFGHTEQDALIPAQLQRDLQARMDRLGGGVKVQVPALACPGWAFENALVVTKQAVSKFEVDDLVFLFVLNDITERDLMWARDGSPDSETPLGKFDRSVEGRLPWVRAIIRHSSLLTALAWMLKGVYAKQQPMDPTLEIIADPPRLQRGVGKLEDGMRWLVRHCEARKIRCTMAIAPYAVQLDEGIGRHVIEQWYGRSYDKRLMGRGPQDALLALCKKTGLDCLDLLPQFAAKKDVGALFFKTPEGRFDYVHFSRAGNDLVGRAIAEHLARPAQLPTAATPTR